MDMSTEESGESEDSTEHSLRESIKRRFCSHDWIYHWSKREKNCRGCGATQPIEKEYTHEDESAEIGDTRIRIDNSRRQFRVEQESYTKTAQGPDDAYFQWFPSGGFYADESELKELRDEIDSSIDTGSGQ